MVEIHFIEIDEIPGLTSEFFVSWFSEVSDIELKELGDINLIFCSDEYLLEHNRFHLNHDFYTDIITHDYSVEECVSGDLYISIDRVKDNAVDFKVSFKHELFRVCVHGLLHLCGYGDKTELDEALMRTKEDYMLAFVPRETFE